MSEPARFSAGSRCPPTQSFNTTTSMGRLTLNVLLSFTQFEREVIGERVRDKIAASKTKGLWVGGPAPLGYRSEKKKLIVVETDAALVRRIFQLYLDLGSVGAVAETLNNEGVRTRPGAVFRVGMLAHLLKNRFYLGEIVWRGASHRGEHAPIVDPEIFEAVQHAIQNAAIDRKGRAANTAYTLAGLLHDDAGNRMSPSHTRKNGARYRYYVSQAVILHRKTEAGSIPRVSAPEIETAVSAAATPRERISRIVLHRHHLLIELAHEVDDAEPPAPLAIPFAGKPQGRRKGIVHEPSQQPRLDHDAAEPILTMIAQARRWMAQLINGSAATTDEIAIREGVGERNIRKLLPLACLSPKIIGAIADGTAPANLTVSKLCAALPHDWATQERRLLVQ